MIISFYPIKHTCDFQMWHWSLLLYWFQQPDFNYDIYICIVIVAYFDVASKLQIWSFAIIKCWKVFTKETLVFFIFIFLCLNLYIDVEVWRNVLTKHNTLQKLLQYRIHQSNPSYCCNFYFLQLLYLIMKKMLIESFATWSLNHNPF